MWSDTGIAPQFATFSINEMRRGYELIAKYGYVVHSDTASHLSMDVTADEQHTQLMLTVPYNTGWSAWVDGQKHDVTSRYGALLSLDVTPGLHHIEFRYLPSGFVLGAIVSGISLLILLGWLFVLRRISAHGK